MVPMDLQIQDRVYLVTASSRGLGYSTARALVNEGAQIILCARSETALKEAVSKLRHNASYIVADLSKSEDIRRLTDHITNSEGHLDGVFVNAGGPPPGSFESLPESAWYDAFELTLMSAVRLTRSSLSLLSASDSPSILYNTSISVKQPVDNLLLSNSLRAAVVGMMRTIATEFGPKGIRVNAICPGYFSTKRVEDLLANAPPTRRAEIEKMIPLGRMGDPTEFGSVCAFLLSPLASYIHGALLLIDGGLYRGML